MYKATYEEILTAKSNIEDNIGEAMSALKTEYEFLDFCRDLKIPVRIVLACGEIHNMNQFLMPSTAECLEKEFRFEGEIELTFTSDVEATYTDNGFYTEDVVRHIHTASFKS